MTTRTYFDEELQELHSSLIKMGVLVEESIEQTIKALLNQDTTLARKVWRSDDAVDDMESIIERQCLILIARQQPLARDLRNIACVLKMITDLERIGDHSADIAELTLRMSEEKYIKPLIDIPKMAELARIMVHDAIDAYINDDVKKATRVCESDDPVDDLFGLIKLELVSIIKKDLTAVDQAINLLFIAKYLERMADHATNIAEWVIFNVTGEHRTFETNKFNTLYGLPPIVQAELEKLDK